MPENPARCLHLFPDPAPNFSSDSEAEKEQYLDTLYERFLADLVHANLVWPGEGSLRISFRRQAEIRGRHASFWHVVSEGRVREEERSLSIERCRRIGWIRPLIDEFIATYPRHDSIQWWLSPRPAHRNRRVLVSLSTFEFVAVFDVRDEYILFVTAYFVEHPHRRRALERECMEFWTRQEPPENQTAPDAPSSPGR